MSRARAEVSAIVSPRDHHPKASFGKPSAQALELFVADRIGETAVVGGVGGQYLIAHEMGIQILEVADGHGVLRTAVVAIRQDDDRTWTPRK